MCIRDRVATATPVSAPPRGPRWVSRGDLRSLWLCGPTIWTRVGRLSVPWGSALTSAHRSRPGARLDTGVEHEGQDMADREVNAPEHARDVALMRRALELAARGPLADPNPRGSTLSVHKATMTSG